MTVDKVKALYNCLCLCQVLIWWCKSETLWSISMEKRRAKPHISISRCRYGTSLRYWPNDVASKENFKKISMSEFHFFSSQCTLQEIENIFLSFSQVIETLNWQMPLNCVPLAFLIGYQISTCLYNSIRHFLTANSAYHTFYFLKNSSYILKWVSEWLIFTSTSINNYY